MDDRLMSRSTQILLIDHEEFVAPTVVLYAEDGLSHLGNPPIALANCFKLQQRLIGTLVIELKYDTSVRRRAGFGRKLSVGLSQLSQLLQEPQPLFVPRIANTDSWFVGGQVRDVIDVRIASARNTQFDLEIVKLPGVVF